MLIVIDYYWKLNYLKRIQKAIQVPTFCLAEDVNFCNKTFFWQIQPQCILAAAHGCRTKLGRFPSLHKLNDCFSKLDTMKLSTSVGLACPSLFPRATRTGGPEWSLAPPNFLRFNKVVHKISAQANRGLLLLALPNIFSFRRPCSQVPNKLLFWCLLPLDGLLL